MASGYGKGSASNDKRVFKAFLNELLSGSPRQDIDYNNKTLRQRSRLLYMTEPLAASLVNNPRNNVVGLGIFAKPRIDFETIGISKEAAEKMQVQFEKEFRLWAEDKYSCDAMGMNNFYGLQQIAFTSWLLSGDVFALFKSFNRTPVRPYGLRLHIIEADRCCTEGNRSGRYGIVGTSADGNQVYDGVEVDKNGMVVAYYIASSYPSDYNYPDKDGLKWQRVPVLGTETQLPNILHVMSAERPDQYRGVPFLSKVIEPLLQIRRYREAELMAAVIQAFFTVFIEESDDSNGNPMFNEPLGDNEEKSTNEDELELGPGNINFLDKGQKANFAQPTHPNSGFSAFCETLICHIASGLGIPKEIVLMCFNSSYSASRAALQEAWKTYRMFRKWFVDDFCQPTYERWLYEAVALGRLSAPGFFNDPIIRKAYSGVEWVGQSQGMIDPTKDVKAAVDAITAGFTTAEAETVRLYGGDIYQNIAQRGHEIELMKEAGMLQTQTFAENPVNNQSQENNFDDNSEDNSDKGENDNGKDENE